jgi:hypothetical protein
MSSATALQPLRNYIRQNIVHLRSTPCLLISSSPPPSVSTAVAGTKNPSSLSTDEKQQKQYKQQLKFQQQQYDPKTHAFVQRNIQSIQLEFNLRTVPCTISSAFPTTESVNEAVSLAKRFGLKEGQFGSGDGLIIGIGSGGAIDLAKAVADSLFGNISSCEDGHNQQEGGSLVLAPSTLGGFMAASSNTPSLLLDTKEAMLLPHLPSSWEAALGGYCRQGTVVTMDQQLSLPPLYSPLQPPKRSESFPGPSMAHYAAATLSILLDLARALDENNTQQTMDTTLLDDMISVASASAAVLELAAKEANENNITVQEGDSYTTAQQHLLNAIPRLSAVVDRSSQFTGSTAPQRLANALLPTYFPNCHLVMYLACILPGLCESLASQSASNVDGTVSIVEELTKSIISCNSDGGNTSDRVQVDSLVSWASQITVETAIPTMASLAFGTPDIHTLTDALDSYDALMGSMAGASAGIRAPADDFALMEDVLHRSLNR